MIAQGQYKFASTRQFKAVLAGVLFAVSLAVLPTPGTASSFPMQGIDGSRQDLYATLPQERWGLVMVWSLDCIPCEAQKPMIREFHAEHAGRDADVIGVVLDGHEARDAILQRLAERPPNHGTLLVFSDVFHEQFIAETGQPFRATPTYLLYRPDGQLAGVHVGPLERSMLENIVATR